MATTLLGMKDLQREIDRFVKDIEAATDPAAMAAGEPIRDAWKSLVPVDEGFYQSSIAVAPNPKSQGGGAVVGTQWLPQLPRNRQPFIYSKVLEYGDSSRAAKPSARPALEQASPAALAAAGVELQLVIKGRKPRKTLPKVKT